MSTKSLVRKLEGLENLGTDWRILEWILNRVAGCGMDSTSSGIGSLALETLYELSCTMEKLKTS
jgi:hypothetical protein